MMVHEPLFLPILVGVFLAAPFVARSALSATAPYGRHETEEPVASLPVRLAWIFMESPTVCAFAYFFFRGPNSYQPVPVFLLALWASHYAYRTLVYPLRMQVGARATMPVKVAASGFSYNVANAYLNATWIGTLGDYPISWLAQPCFLIGLAVFVVGYVMNRHADAVLRALRGPGETGYKIPVGGMYRWISCPNYFGEFLIWTGWAIATWSLAGLSFAVFTAANLGPRAMANHRWYQDTFDDYPVDRKAVVPFLL